MADAARIRCTRQERQPFAARLADLQEKLTVADARLVEAHGDRDAAIRRAEAAIVAQSEAEKRSETLLSEPTLSRCAPAWRRTGLSRHVTTWSKLFGKGRIYATKSAICAGSWR